MPTNGSEGWDHTDPDDLRELYHEQGKSLSETADACGVAFGTIQYHMDKHDIERPKFKRPEAGGSVPYKMIYHREDGVNYHMFVHRLVAYAHGMIDGDELMEASGDIHHKNGIVWDNSPENLEHLPPSDHQERHANR